MSMTLFTGTRLTTSLLAPEPASPVQPRFSPVAVAAAVCAVLGFLNTAGFFAGVVLGHVAWGQIRRSEGGLRGRRLALAALLVSWAPIVLVAVVFVLMFLIGLDVTVHGS